MTKKIEVTAEDRAKIEAFDKAFPVGTECAVVLDDGSRKIMFVVGGALYGKDGIKATVNALTPGNTTALADDEPVLIARIRSRCIEKRSGKDQLRVDLTDVERLEFGNEMADLFAVADQLTKDAKQSVSQFKAKIEQAESSIKVKSDLLRAGYEIRSVECETLIDFDKQRAIKRRKDIGAVIEDRPLRPDESQREMTLFPAAVTETEHEKKSEQEQEQEPEPETPVVSIAPPNEDLERARALIRETKRASETSIRKAMNVGTARAVQILDALEAAGVIGPAKANGGTRDIMDIDASL